MLVSVSITNFSYYFPRQGSFRFMLLNRGRRNSRSSWVRLEMQRIPQRSGGAVGPWGSTWEVRCCLWMLTCPLSKITTSRQKQEGEISGKMDGELPEEHHRNLHWNEMFLGKGLKFNTGETESNQNWPLEQPHLCFSPALLRGWQSTAACNSKAPAGWWCQQQDLVQQHALKKDVCIPSVVMNWLAKDSTRSEIKTLWIYSKLTLGVTSYLSHLAIQSVDFQLPASLLPTFLQARRGLWSGTPQALSDSRGPLPATCRHVRSALFVSSSICGHMNF